MSFARGVPVIFNYLDQIPNATKAISALGGAFLVAKGFDGSSHFMNPVYAGVGGVMASPAIASAILKDVVDYPMVLTKTFSMSAKRLTTLGLAALFATTAPMMSTQFTQQTELHNARKDACNGADVGKVSFVYKGQNTVVDCATMLAPIQQP